MMFKVLVTLATFFVVWVSTMCLVMSFLTWQIDGMFYYGLFMIGSGLMLKTEVDTFWKL